MLRLTRKIVKDELHLVLVFFKVINQLKFINFYLFKASENGHNEVFQELLKHNANIDLKDESGRTALFYG